MEIIKAKYAGFCTGVRRALRIAEQAASEGGKWSSLGYLVHNRFVIEKLAAQEVTSIDDISEVNGSGLIIRAHGVEPRIIEKAQALGLEVRDATCFLVQRVQRIGRQLIEEGYQVIVFGDREHPEVCGILGWCNYQADVVGSLDELQLIDIKAKVGIISQTTKDERHFYEIVQALLPLTQELRVFFTICPATQKRQQEAYELSSKVDMMLVLGDQRSSNTTVLYNISKTTGVKTLLVESADGLEPQMFKGIRRVGITAGASTPDFIIKEVIDKMTEMEENLQEQELIQDNNSGEDTFKQLEAQMADREIPGRGDIVTGTVVEVRDDEVMVDVGGKSEGVVPLRELSNQDLKSAKDVAAVGDQIDVVVLKWDDDGNILLSKKKVDNRMAMDKLEQVFKEDGLVTGIVKESVKGGLLIDIDGVIGFLPASHVEIGYVKNLDNYIGGTFNLKIIEFNRDKRRGSQIVLSRKVLLEAERKTAKEEFWSQVAEGQVWKGRVKRLVDYGAFIDLGGFEGLLHISEIDHVRIDHPSDVLKEGEEIEVYILAPDYEKQRVPLSRKKLLKSPWEKVIEKYHEGDIIDGQVVRMAPFGAFVEIEPGFDGLVHISQIADTRIDKPESVLSIGEPVKVKILSIDYDEHKVGLSIKDANNAQEEAKIDDFPVQQQEEETVSAADESAPATEGTAETFAEGNDEQPAE